ncbi:Response regulator PleD [compost metagenome]
MKNRRFFQEKLEDQIIFFRKTDKPFSVFILDIDHFKKVNDTWGHQTGDDVLEKLAQILQAFSRKGDIVVARYGGEEFVLILPDIDIDESRAIAERLRIAVAGSTWKTGSITISIGIGTFAPTDSDSTILKKADQALYASKENGRNRVTHYEDIEAKLL